MLNGNKIVAIIPLRLGSQRCKDKNLRLLNNKILPLYMLEAAKASNIFDEIYINSSSDFFEYFAKQNDVRFFKRKQELSDAKITHEQFVYDFCKEISSDFVVMLHSTSPFIKPETIRKSVETMIENKYDTLMSCKEEQEMVMYKSKAVNFSIEEPFYQSQKLEPIREICWPVTAWKTKELIKAYENKKSSTFIGNIGFFQISKLESVDIHSEEDFLFAEMLAKSLNTKEKYIPQYYNEVHSESDVPSILKKDGVHTNDLHDCNKLITNSDTIRNIFGNMHSWSKRVVNTENNSATLIQQMPGEGNRRHYHPEWNEWWFIVDGEWEWEVEGVKHLIKKNDIVFIPKGKIHKITAVGSKPAIRLAVSREDVPHIYPDGDHSNARKD